MTSIYEHGRARLLVIEDNPTNMKLTVDVLEAEGFMIERATDAEEAQTLLEGPLPDLILTDIALPGLDGLTFARQCKADPKLRHIPIVALTAFAMKGDDAKALAAGCDGYITKPIQTRELARQIREFLQTP
jgi:CheY-like chemotaxis protein